MSRSKAFGCHCQTHRTLVKLPNLTIIDSAAHLLDMCNPGTGILWTGHNDGKICALALDAKPGVALTGRILNSWQAHRIGGVTVLVTTPWGELWSGSSRGIIRVWRNAHKQGGGAAPFLVHLFVLCMLLGDMHFMTCMSYCCMHSISFTDNHGSLVRFSFLSFQTAAVAAQNNLLLEIHLTELIFYPVA